MDLWFTEYHHGKMGLAMKTTRTLYHEESEYQTLDIIETEFFGRVMLLDGLIMLTERDEFIYHDMISHVPMAVAPNPERILIIGGGDGGTARELLRYPSVKHVDLVDIDEMVTRASKEFFPVFQSAFRDERLHTYFEDGVAFVKRQQEKYDVIIIDSTDPIGPGEGLFTTEFYTDCKNLLNPKGILVNQSESPQWDPDIVQSIYRKLSKIFPIFKFYQASIPTYPSGHWLFSFASNDIDPLKDFDGEKWEKLGLRTRYYNPDVHRGSFAMPNFVRELMNA